MAKPLTAFDIEYKGETHRVEVRSMDMVRFEQTFETSVGRLDGSIVEMFKMAWVVLRHRKIDVPDSFDAFLEGDPDIDMASVESNEEGKGSGQEASTS